MLFNGLDSRSGSSSGNGTNSVELMTPSPGNDLELKSPDNAFLEFKEEALACGGIVAVRLRPNSQVGIIEAVDGCVEDGGCFIDITGKRRWEMYDVIRLRVNFVNHVIASCGVEHDANTSVDVSPEAINSFKKDDTIQIHQYGLEKNITMTRDGFYRLCSKLKLNTSPDNDTSEAVGSDSASPYIMQLLNGFRENRKR